MLSSNVMMRMMTLATFLLIMSDFLDINATVLTVVLSTYSVCTLVQFYPLDIGTDQSLGHM